MKVNHSHKLFYVEEYFFFLTFKKKHSTLDHVYLFYIDRIIHSSIENTSLLSLLKKYDGINPPLK